MKCTLFLFSIVLMPIIVAGQWTQTVGPAGGMSNEIFYAGNYLIVNGYDGGIYRSSDQAMTWTPVNNGLPTDFRCFAMDMDNDVLYIATNHGIYSSTNFGDTWLSLTDHEITGFSIHVSGTEIFVGSTNHIGLFYSADRGSTWISRNIPNPEETVRQILKVGSTLWLGTDTALYSSLDNGANWVSHLNWSAAALYSAGDDLIVSGNLNGFFVIYRHDAGGSWTQLESTPETNIPAGGILQHNNVLYVSGFAALYFSTDNGLTWSSQSLPHSYNLFQQTSIVAVDTGLFLSCGDGILFTPDIGQTWERRNVGLKNQSIIQLARTNHSIVSLSETNGVYISTDDGNSWKWIPDHESYRPRNIYAYNNTIFVSYLLGIYKSVDEGETWEKVFTLTDDIPGTHTIPDTQLSGSKEFLVFSTYKGVYFSTDMGSHWELEPISTFSISPFIPKCFVQDDTVALLTEKELAYSTDFCKTWERKPLPELLVVSPLSVTGMLFEKSSIIMSTFFGLYKSPDFGSTWKHITCIPDLLIYDIKQINNTLVLSTYSGVYTSNDGVAWHAIRNGLGDARVLTMTITNNFSFAGTWGKSVWKISLPQLLSGEIVATGEGSPPKPIIEVNCTTLTIINTPAQTQIKWFKNGTLLPAETNSTLEADGAGIYSAVFENSCDLKPSDNIQIKEEISKVEVNIYNIVTANGDGKNDYYFVDTALKGSRLQVFNRWGDIIYSNDFYQNEWSPTEIASGQYFYAITNKCYGTFKGTLTILEP